MNALLRIISIMSLVLLGTGTASALPTILALPLSLDSLTVKIIDTAAYPPGTPVTYDILHWPDSVRLKQGTVAANKIADDGVGYPSFTLTGLTPQPWTLQDPQLYTISVKNNTGQLIGEVRFGFRTFAVVNRKFELNGRPVFLRSNPINPPGRDLPTSTGTDPGFIRGYLTVLKNAGVNLIRTSTDDWLNVCDELGIMCSQGNYASAPGGTQDAPPAVESAKPSYRDMVLGLANHASVTIYYLTNEVNRTAYDTFLESIRAYIGQIDPTRPVIGNAGWGKGQGGEIYDHHQYTGWYYGNAHEWYNLKNTLALADAAGQPLTISEHVAAYTSDAGIFQTMSKQMSNHLRWSGPVSGQRASALEYQAELTKQCVEIARRLRTSQTGVAGVMPFTYFFGWASATSADNLIIKPAYEAMKTSFQPVLISPECWKRNLFAGDNLQIRLYAINDDDTGRNLAASQGIVEVAKVDGTVVASGQVAFPAVPYYGGAYADISIPLPASTPRGDYAVRCRLMENGQQISSNRFDVFIAPRTWPSAAGTSVYLYDPDNSTAACLQQLGVQYTILASISTLPGNGALVLGERSFGTARPSQSETLAFLNRGGRILCLRQPEGNWNSDWLPATFTMSARSRLTYIHPVGGNQAIFEGIRGRDLRYWNEVSRYSNGSATVEPVLALLWPASHADLASARCWASSERLLSGAAILEIFHGQGSVVISTFRTTERVPIDPIAAKLLANLVKYAASAEHYGLLDLTKPIKWDVEAFRTGVFCSKKQGFLPHSPVYAHTGGSKGNLGADHGIDGSSLVGTYDFDGNGYVTPVPDPAVEGWGVFYGRLSRQVTRFSLTLRNDSLQSAQIRLKIDDQDIGSPQTLSAGQQRTIEWAINRQAGPVKVELRGDQDLVITASQFL